MPGYVAVSLALGGSALVGLALAALGVFTLDLLLRKLGGVDGPGAGVLIICAIPNIAIPAFVSCFSILLNWHHAISWRSPTFAFALGASLFWVWARFGVTDILFAPVVLGTGAIACVFSCLFLRRKLTSSDHVIEA
jgi:hypothetical protein